MTEPSQRERKGVDGHAPSARKLKESGDYREVALDTDMDEDEENLTPDER